MTPETVVALGRDALWLLIVIVCVVLIPALVVGLAVSIFQAATQINEQTMSFIPKLLVTFTVILFAGPWIIMVLTEYFTRLMNNVPSVIG